MTEEILKVCLNSYYLHPYCLFYHPLLVAMASVVLFTFNSNTDQDLSPEDAKKLILQHTENEEIALKASKLFECEIDPEDLAMLALDMRQRHNN